MISLTEAIRRLQETLENKSQVRQDIVNVEGKIIEHLLKCFLYKDSTNNLNHWKQEIFSFLYEVPKLKIQRNSHHINYYIVLQ